MQSDKKELGQLPDFLVVGAARSGTTALYSLLKNNPQIFMPREKEPMFFCCWNQSDYFQFTSENSQVKTDFIIKNLEEYKQLFKKARKNQILGEGSTWYLYAHQTVIQNIKRCYGDDFDSLKIIILLRNPIQRAWSHYWTKHAQGYEFLPFLDSIEQKNILDRLKQRYTPSYDYIGFGKYYRQVKSFLHHFSNVKVILFEEFINSSEEKTNEIFRFLGAREIKNVHTKLFNTGGLPKNKAASLINKMILKPNKWRSYFKHLLPFAVRRDIRYYLGEKIFSKPELPIEYKKILTAEYEEDIQKLAGLIKKDLSHWMN
ncbi:MAG: hypothetical protein GF421_02330 [Candidatus Aminicenantes bacterium]|nr:hypothetical protein [Candidatus Aminicenantes bacterium]